MDYSWGPKIIKEGRILEGKEGLKKGLVIWGLESLLKEVLKNWISKFLLLFGLEDLQQLP